MPRLDDNFYSERKVWKSIDKKLPTPFDLVQLKTVSDRKLLGWFTGNSKNFDGFKLKSDDEIIAWREWRENETRR